MVVTWYAEAALNRKVSWVWTEDTEGLFIFPKKRTPISLLSVLRGTRQFLFWFQLVQIDHSTQEVTRITVIWSESFYPKMVNQNDLLYSNYLPNNQMSNVNTGWMHRIMFVIQSTKPKSYVIVDPSNPRSIFDKTAWPTQRLWQTNSHNYEAKVAKVLRAIMRCTCSSFEA